MLGDGVGDRRGVVGQANPVLQDDRNVEVVEPGAQQLKEAQLRENSQMLRLENGTGVDEHLAVGESSSEFLR